MSLKQRLGESGRFEIGSYYNLACVCAIRGEKEKGITHLKKAISLNRAVIDWARADAD